MSLSAYFGSLSVANLLSRMPAAAAQGMIWGLMALGVFITFRVLDIADLTVDGSFATGGAVTVMLLLAGWPSWAALLAAFAAGVLTGLVTGLLHTKLGIPAILAGILTQFSLYSINLRIMTKANQTASIKKFGMFWEGPTGFSRRSMCRRRSPWASCSRSSRSLCSTGTSAPSRAARCALPAPTPR